MEPTPDLMQRLIPSALGVHSTSCRVEPLRGGLESAVARVRFEHAGREGKMATGTAIVKRLNGPHRREARLYSRVAKAGFAPALLGAAEEGEAVYLFLEQVRPVSRWPWRNEDDSRLVIRQLAALHASDVVPADEEKWEYESALAISAAETVGIFDQVKLEEFPLRSCARTVSRVASLLPAGRLQMMSELGRTFIHGDAHPGNVMIRERGGRRTAVLLDWARSRFGSPLEDLASWLQTLRYWEPAAAQRHDSLFAAYLEARNLRPLDRAIRDAYWIASASNVMAGALRFHLWRATETKGREREHAIGQTAHALRIIRRADAILRR